MSAVPSLKDRFVASEPEQSKEQETLEGVGPEPTKQPVGDDALDITQKEDKEVEAMVVDTQEV